jgi:hypothetical protein
MVLIHKPQRTLSTQRRFYIFYKGLNFNYFYKMDEQLIFLKLFQFYNFLCPLCSPW